MNDAFVAKGLRPGIDFIFYNNDKDDNRMKHTLWHEIGHIKCGHKKHDDKEEIEAHFFAAQANAPNIIIKTIAQKGYNINVPFLIECFGMSEESANKKMDYLSKYSFEHSNEYDEFISTLFSSYINKKYPIRTKVYYDDDFDELEEERNKWY